MKSNELRIGNYLYYKGTEYIATVELIHNKHFDCRDELGLFTPNAIYEPIEITERWLKMFGFKPRKDAEWCYEKGLIMVNAGNHMIVHICDKVTSVKYVHQLQNLYHSITGNELSI